MKKKKKPLSDHKKVGSKFKPPFSQLPGTWKEIRYDLDILPEIIWMGLLNDEYEYHRGTELVELMCTKADELHSPKHPTGFAFASSYNSADEAFKTKLIATLKEEKVLKAIQLALEPLVILYQDFPMAFLGLGRDTSDRRLCIEKVTNCVKRHLDRYDTPGLVIQANVVYVDVVTERLVYTSQVRPPDLNSILEKPGSVEADRAGSHVRMGVRMKYGNPDGGIPTHWQRSFWNQNLHLAPCQLRGRSNV